MAVFLLLIEKLQNNEDSGRSHNKKHAKHRERTIGMNSRKMNHGVNNQYIVVGMGSLISDKTPQKTSRGWHVSVLKKRGPVMGRKN